MEPVASWCVWLGWAAGWGLVIAFVPIYRRVPKVERGPLPGTLGWVIVGSAAAVMVSLGLPWVQGISNRTFQPLSLPAWPGMDPLSVTLVIAVLVEALMAGRRGGGLEPTDGLGGGGGRPCLGVLVLGVLCAVAVLGGNQVLRLVAQPPSPAWGSWVGLGAAVVLLGATATARVRLGAS